VEADDADPVIKVEERMGGRIVPEKLARGEGRRAGRKMVESLRRDEPGLAASENVEGFHAPEGLSTETVPYTRASCTTWLRAKSPVRPRMPGGVCGGAGSIPVPTRFGFRVVSASVEYYRAFLQSSLRVWWTPHFSR
jgi:hypothetical protein